MSKFNAIILWAVFGAWLLAVIVAIALGITEPETFPQQPYPPAGYPLP